MATFQEYRDKVPITTVAESIGYVVDLKKGKKTLEFKHPDGDTILIDPVRKMYFNRDGTTDRGDVVEFVKNRLDRFNVSYNNETHGINQVLQTFANEPQKIQTTQAKFIAPEPKIFDSSRYEVNKASIFKLHYLIKERGLEIDTVKRFLPFISLVKDTQLKGEKSYENIGFALTKPGSKDVVGWDLRNYAFKGVAAGSDRQNGMWIADFVGSPARTRNVIFGETPIDLMSFYQLNKNKLDLDNAAFVSFGGGIAKSQMQTALSYWSDAKKHTAFDNDYQGKMYDIALAVHVSKKDVPLPVKKDDSLLFNANGKQFEIPVDKISLFAFEAASGIRSNVVVHKATGEANGRSFKDFNDILHPRNQTRQAHQHKL